MESILFSILELFAGCGVFIAGLNMMSSGLQKSAGSGMKKLLGSISGNRLAGVGIGATVTGIIQSSAATTVMAIGFVNAGIMTLFQATAIIMGANIGTTVTGLIVSLKSLNISLYASAFAFIGVMMTFFSKEKIKQIGNVICGLGLVFIGLDLMSAAFDSQTMKDLFISVFSAIEFPLLLIICGILVTALIQSSSAVTGLVIIMVGSGALPIDNALFIVLGSNIGTCITAILASIGTSTNAKRTAFIHLAFNVIGTIIFTTFIWIFKDLAVTLITSLPLKAEMQIAFFHLIFNVTTTLILLPFIKQLVSLAEHVIRDKKAEEHRSLKYLDKRLLKTPSIALAQVKKEVEYMASVAKENTYKSFYALKTGNVDYNADIAENEAIIDFTNNELTKFLIELSSVMSGEEEKVIGSYFHVLNDLERVGDHSENFLEISTQMKEEGLAFSQMAINDIETMYNKVYEMFDIAMTAFDNPKTEDLNKVDALEEEVDNLKKTLSANHFTRLSKGECKVELSAYYFSVLAGYERVADHLVYVGWSIVNPTGDQF